MGAAVHSALAEPVNILLVDDQPAKLMSYELILQDLGENLLKASSAHDALEMLLKNDVAVILADVCMPDMDGFELAKMIREHPRFKETAIIFVSAVHLSDLDSLKGYELGGVDYVPVPVVPGILRAKVKVFVELHRKTRELARMNGALELRVAERTSELEAAIGRQELLAREVDHRARNALAVIQSIVRLTPSDSPSDFIAAIKGRIRAMATAHNLLSETRWRGANLSRVVSEELAPFHVQDRVEVKGPAIEVMPTVAQNLALAIHELATNAAKYGALADSTGRLSVVWSLSEDELIFEWREQSARAVSAPKRTGFGSRVLKASIEGQLDGRAIYDWRPDGLKLTVRVPRRHFVRSDDAVRPSAKRPEHDEDFALPFAHIHGRRVLILEDEPLVALMMAELVSDLGGAVVGPFSNVREALARTHGDLDAALLDVNVGEDLAYPVAEKLANAGVPVIFVTGYQAAAMDERFAHMPVLTKPVEFNELALALTKVIREGEPAAV